MVFARPGERAHSVKCLLYVLARVLHRNRDIGETGGAKEILGKIYFLTAKYARVMVAQNIGE